MPATDICAPAIVRALTKDGWQVSPKSYQIWIDKLHRLHVDLEARYGQPPFQTIMIVEIKCFNDRRTEVPDLYTAIGQYLVYRSLMHQKEIRIPLYLAVPLHAYEGVFDRMGMPAIHDNKIKMIVVNIEKEEISQWLS